VNENETLPYADEELASLLAACDEALEVGIPPAALSVTGAPAWGQRLEEDVACVEMLRRLWPRPGALPNQPDAGSPQDHGRHIGRFEIRRELGRGGFGVVFLAYDPHLRREVALKIARADILQNSALRARLQQEARAAAALDHPNVVPVYEAGAIGPICYIAAAYCPGRTLAQHLAEQTAPVSFAEAATVVAALADGVHHAHRRGILHRDLKPSNILLQAVDGGPTTIAKITDFGLAKLLDEDVGVRSQSGSIVGTPNYMAPEQAAGSKDITTAADIYALGVILYEMITGRTPFESDVALQTLRRLESEEPLPPGRRRPGLARDLETICLKCLHKEPGRRYVSAAALAEDLRRFLSGEPVHARAVGTPERIWRWCRRKPALAALAGSLLLVAGVGTAGIFWQWQRAERHVVIAGQKQKLAEEQSRKARQAVHDYFILVSENKLLGRPGYQELRKDLLETALRHYEGFLHERDDDPAVQQEVAATRVRVAIIHDLIGSKEAALAAFQEAILLYDRLHGERPGEAALQVELARAYRRLGALLTEMEKLEDALAALNQARTQQEDLLANDPARPEFAADLAQTLAETSRVHWNRGQGVLALEHAERALEICTRLAGSHPERDDFQFQYSEGLARLGDLYFLQRDVKKALESFQKGRAVCERLVEQHPSEDRFKTQLVEIHNKMAAVCRSTGAADQGIAALVLGRAVAEKLVYLNPSVTDYQWLLARTLLLLEKLYSEVNQLPKGLACSEEARPLVEKLIRLNPTLPDFRKMLAEIDIARGHLLSNLGRPGEAIGSFETASGTLEQLARDFPDTVEFKHALGITYHNLGNELRQAGQFERSLAVLSKGRELRLRMVDAFPGVPEYQYHLALIYNQIGAVYENDHQPNRALENKNHGLELCAALHEKYPTVVDYHRRLATCYMGLADLERQLGRPAEAEALYRKALDIRLQFARGSPVPTDAHMGVGQAYRDLGELKIDAKDYPEALRLYDCAREHFEKAVRDNSRHTLSRSCLGQSWDGRAQALAGLGRREEAMRAYQQAVDIQCAVVAQVPHQRLYRERLDAHYEHLSLLHRNLGQPVEATILDQKRRDLWAKDLKKAEP
jgi:tetratricopeptide (TPR) repeat protein/tRNA A-37 threonylcarbamoyl transferase component Bud32